MTKSRKIIGDSLRCGIYKSKQGLKIKEVYQPVNEVISGYCSVFRNSPIKNFGHSLIQFIPRCYLLNQPEYRGLDEIKLLCSEPITKLEKFCLPKILPPNVRITPVPPGLYQVENLIFPSFLQPDRANGALPSSYVEEVRSKFLPKRPRKRNNRIYISRSKYADMNSRHVLNEKELFSELSKLGFRQYRTEEMSIPEQIDLFYDAEVVVGANGSALANLLYSEKATLLELNPCKKGMNFFNQLCHSLGHTRLCWEGSGTKFHSNFDVDIPEVLKMLSSSGIYRKI